MLLRFMVLHQRLLSCSTFSGASNCYLLASSRKPFSCAHLRTAGQCLRQHRSAAAAAHAQQDVKEPDVKPLQHSDTGAQEQPPQDQPNAKSRQEDVAIHFSADGVYTTAAPGDNLWAVASKCGVTIPTSCNSGSCGTCEMEVRKWDAQGVEGGTAIARTCIAAVPPGYARLQIDALDDDIWGMDGFDT